MNCRRSFFASLLPFFVGGASFFGAGAHASSNVPSPEPSVISCTLLLDPVTGVWLHREGDDHACKARRAPMSSFKFPLAVMGYDAGILIDSARPAWPYREGHWAFRDEERQVITPAAWESISVLWYSREITRRLGERKLADYVKRFGYGNADVTGNPGRNDGLAASWLMSSLLISPEEQALFTRRFLRRELGVSAATYLRTEEIIPRFEAANGWTLHGKTGSGWWSGTFESPDRTRPQGWFTGWAEKGGRRIVFVKWVAGERPFTGYGGPLAREMLLAEWSRLGV